MGTEKRERQKANRQQRLEEEAKAERAGTVKRNVLRWGLGLVAAVGAVILIAWIGGAFGGDDEPAEVEPAITLPPLDTTPVETLPVETLPTPDVEIPDALPTDLVVTELQAGEGPEAQAGDTVVVNYVGVRSEDGTEFDNSYDRGQPFPVVLGSGSVIPGWDEGLVGVQEGARVQLDIPADLAYGDNPNGTIIQPGDSLTFVIDVVSVTPPVES